MLGACWARKGSQGIISCASKIMYIVHVTGRKEGHEGSKGTSGDEMEMCVMEERQAYRCIGDNGWKATSEDRGH